MNTVLHVLKMPENNGYVGGIVAIVNSYLKQKETFAEHGFEIELFSYRLPDLLKKVPPKIGNVLYGIGQALALRRKVKETENVIIHIHTSRSFLFLKDVLLAEYLNKKCGCAVILTIHVGKTETIFARIAAYKNKCIEILNKNLSKVIFLGNELKDDFIKMGLNNNKCEVLYNFHDLTVSNDTEMSISKARIRLLYVGALYRQKGIIDLLNALDMVNIDYELNICGQLTEPSMADEFDQCIRKLGNRVHLLGYVSGTEKTRVFQSADILV